MFWILILIFYTCVLTYYIDALSNCMDQCECFNYKKGVQQTKLSYKHVMITPSCVVKLYKKENIVCGKICYVFNKKSTCGGNSQCW